MSINTVTRDIEALEDECREFLTTEDFSDEEKQELAKVPTPLQIKAFNTIVSECKNEIANSSTEKMSGILHLLYNIETEPFVSENISKNIEDFVTIKLSPSALYVTESEIYIMNKITENIDTLCHSLVTEQRRLNIRSKKWHVYNKNARDLVAQNYKRLATLKKKIEFQIEYNSRQIADLVIEDFYNIYIFFSYIIRMALVKKQELLTIEIANFIDRFINIINHIFNNRHLKNQDMLYYYVVYELNELKTKIYNHLTDYKSLL